MTIEERLAAAEERLRLARLALIETGYFRENEVGPDIAPRISELYAALSDSDELPDEPPTSVGDRWTMLEVPVIDGIATLPDGRTVQSHAAIVAVPVLRHAATTE